MPYIYIYICMFCWHEIFTWLKVKNELPSTFKAYRYQQHRWSCGPANLFRKMVMEIVRNKVTVASFNYRQCTGQNVLATYTPNSMCIIVHCRKCQRGRRYMWFTASSLFGRLSPTSTRLCFIALCYLQQFWCLRLRSPSGVLCISLPSSPF